MELHRAKVIISRTEAKAKHGYNHDNNPDMGAVAIHKSGSMASVSSVPSLWLPLSPSPSPSPPPCHASSAASLAFNRSSTDANFPAKFTAVFQGQQQTTGPVTCLAVKGDLVFSGDTGGGVTVWKRPQLTPGAAGKLELVPLAHLGGHGGAAAVKSIAVNGDVIFTAHQDHRIRVWRLLPVPGNTNTILRKVATLPTTLDHVRNYVMMSIIRRGSSAAADGRYVEERRRTRGRLTWTDHADVVSCVAVSAVGTGALYSASWDRSVKVWRLSDLACVESFRAHDDAINAMALLSPPPPPPAAAAEHDGDSPVLVFTASADSTIKVWRRMLSSSSSSRRRPFRHVLMSTLRRHRSAVNAVALSEDGGLLYSGGGAADKCVLVWRLCVAHQDWCSLCGALRGHSGAILSVATGGSHFVCSASADKSIRVWRRNMMTATRAGACWCPSPSRVDKSEIIHWCVAVLRGHSAPVKSLSMTVLPHSQSDSDSESSVVMLYSGGLDKQLRVWLLSLSPAA